MYKKTRVLSFVFLLMLQSCQTFTKASDRRVASDYELTPSQRLDLYEPAAAAFLKVLSVYDSEKLTPKEKAVRIQEIKNRYNKSFGSSAITSVGASVVLFSGSAGIDGGGTEFGQVIAGIGSVVLLGVAVVSSSASSSGGNSLEKGTTKKLKSAFENDPSSMRDINRRVEFFAKSFDLSVAAQEKVRKIYYDNIFDQLMDPNKKIDVSKGIELDMDKLKADFKKSNIFTAKQQKLIDGAIAYHKEQKTDTYPSVSDLFSLLRYLRTGSIALELQIPKLDGELAVKAKAAKANADLEAIKLAEALKNEKEQ
jgi:hypothetical protein